MKIAWTEFAFKKLCHDTYYRSRFFLLLRLFPLFYSVRGGVRSGDIQVMLSKIEQTDEYGMDASKSEERVGQLPGFRDFDPRTAGGSENWDMVKKVLVAYGSKSVNAAVDE